MYALEQSLLVLALVGACGLAYRLLRGEAGGGSCDAGGSCDCAAREGEPGRLTHITGSKKGVGSGRT